MRLSKGEKVSGRIIRGPKIFLTPFLARPIGTDWWIVKDSCNVAVEAAEGHVGIWHYRLHSTFDALLQIEIDSWGIQCNRLPHVVYRKDPNKDIDLFYFIAPFWLVNLCLLIPPAAAILLTGEKVSGRIMRAPKIFLTPFLAWNDAYRRLRDLEDQFA